MKNSTYILETPQGYVEKTSVLGCQTVRNSQSALRVEENQIQSIKEALKRRFGLNVKAVKLSE
ncbi:MAG TPA: hypothetical protein V6C95_21875 [Coleofasciculaceae cyanobacterium]